VGTNARISSYKLHMYFVLLALSKPLNKIVTSPDIWGFSSVGRASDLHSEGQEFESPSLQYAAIAQLVRARH
jgi:hypothetical protein